MSNQKRKDHSDSIRKHLSLDERKARKQRSRERKAGREGPAPRRQGYDSPCGGDDDEEGFHAEDLEFEYRSRTRSAPPAAGGSTPAPTLPAGEVAGRGLVAAVTTGRARVHLLDGPRNGEVLDLVLAPWLAREQQTRVAVGDHVLLQERAPDVWLVADVEPRRSVLSRPDPGVQGRERVIAANVDVGVLVLNATRPSIGLVDRALVALGRGEVRALVCLNKADLLDGKEREEIAEILAPYPDLGASWQFTSCSTGEGIEELRSATLGASAVLFGHSGVGKSSLLNAVDPEGQRLTGDVRESDGKGRHTTTTSDLRRDGEGSVWIDTPGVRAFGLWDVSPAELIELFPDLGEMAQACRFRDCRHAAEPDCAVREAAETDPVLARRYASYQRILSGLS